MCYTVSVHAWVCTIFCNVVKKIKCKILISCMWTLSLSPKTHAVLAIQNMRLAQGCTYRQSQPQL